MSEQVRVDAEFFEKFEIGFEVHQVSVLFHLLFAVVVDVVTEVVRVCVLSELPYVDE